MFFNDYDERVSVGLCHKGSKKLDKSEHVVFEVTKCSFPNKQQVRIGTSVILALLGKGWGRRWGGGWGEGWGWCAGAALGSYIIWPVNTLVPCYVMLTILEAYLRNLKYQENYTIESNYGSLKELRPYLESTDSLPARLSFPRGEMCNLL